MRSFHAKILLAGEYTILDGAGALAIPWREKEACWTLRTVPEESLQKFALWADANIPELLDTQRMLQDVEGGLHWYSSIPRGYGVGSSGALVAGWYDRYALNPKQDPIALQKELALCESYHHGSSSGIDPLVSYLNKSIYINAQQEVQVLHLPPPVGQWFLLDSGVNRNTNEAIAMHKKVMLERGDVSQWMPDYITIVQNLIQEVIAGGDVCNPFREISNIQYTEFSHCILPEIKPLWKQGLESNAYYLKLCGAGGGGYYLGWTNKSIKELKTFLPEQQLEVIDW